MPKESQTINISIVSILKILAVLVAIFFLYLIRDIIAILFVSVIFGAAIDPMIDWFQKKKIPRPLSILGMYAIGLGALALVVVLLVPALAREITNFAGNFPDYYQRIMGGIEKFQDQSPISQNINNVLESWAAAIGRNAGSIFSTVSNIFGGFVSLLAVLVITFYLIVKKDNMRNFLQTVTPMKYQPYMMQLYLRMQDKIGMWLRGQIILMFIIGALSYVGLLILGVEYALLLGIFAGLTEIIPYVGPIIGAVPAVLLAFTQSPLKALLVIALYLVIQQLENNLVVPKIMKKAVGLNPIVIMLVILVGGKLGGVVGALIAVPVATAFSVVVKDFFDLRKQGEAKD